MNAQCSLNATGERSSVRQMSQENWSTTISILQKLRCGLRLLSEEQQNWLYSVESWQQPSSDILSVSLVPFLQKTYSTGHRLYQDNDPKHTSRHIQAFFAQNGINQQASCPERFIERTWLNQCLHCNTMATFGLFPWSVDGKYLIKYRSCGPQIHTLWVGGINLITFKNWSLMKTLYM